MVTLELTSDTNLGIKESNGSLIKLPKTPKLNIYKNPYRKTLDKIKIRRREKVYLGY